MISRTFAAALYLCCAVTLVERADAQLPFDDVKGRALDYATHQIRPLATSSDGTLLYAVNQPGSRLAVFELPGLARIADIPVGPGLVSVVERVPGEAWLVDAVQHSITIIDVPTQRIRRTVRVGAEPHGLAFTPDGSRAYVACSAVHRVDVIDAHALTVVKSIDIPAMNPRAVEWLDGRVWIASFRSGNNTAPMGRDSGIGRNDVIAVKSLADFPELNQLPDRDLFSITPAPDPADDALDATVHKGLGTILMNMAARPGTRELWIANTEALNGEFRGERAFLEGQVVSNRITILDVGTGARQVIDLDALAPEGAECAQPAGLSFTPDGSRAFVAGYGSDRVAVLDVDGSATVSWAGYIRVRAGQPYPEGAGPRATLVSPDGTTLHVFSKIDNGIVSVPLANLPPASPFAYIAPLPIDVGFSPVSGRELRGRFLFSNAEFSKSRTSSCASCHIDATSDGLAWDLSGFLDPEGTDADALRFGVDVKGPLVTQNTLRLGETAPYHWRGEKQKLVEFNDAFPNLLEHEVDGEPATIGGHFQYIVDYMQHLAIPANPRQELDRSLTAEQARGAELFQSAASFRGLACADCHALPLGTSGEYVGFKAGGSSKSGVIPHLRGVEDKLAASFHIGGAFGTRTELGAGLLHGGAVPNPLRMMLMPDPEQPDTQLFDLTVNEARDIAAFLAAFDTGLAPATTVQVTAHAGNWDDDAQDLIALLMQQATAGHCDLICRRAPLDTPNGIIHRSMLFDPVSAKFQPARRAGSRITLAALLAEAAAGSPVTFLGVPRHSGLQMALDRDMDGAWDLDELSVGTDPENFDHDEDGFPDGYELLWGMDPKRADASSPDATAPSLLAAPNVVFSTQTAIKLEFATDEMARVHVSVDGTLVRRAPFGAGFDTEFQIVLGELQAGTSYELGLELLDPAGNTQTLSFPLETQAKVLKEPVHVRAIEHEILPVPGNARPNLLVTVHLAQGNAPAVGGYRVWASVYHRRAADGHLTLIVAQMKLVLGGADGRALLRTELPHITELGGQGELIIVVQDVEAPDGAPVYVEALDVIGQVTFAY